jgi:hypothetical protein
VDSKAEKTRVVYREAECIFCGSTDMSEEHLLADWMFRAVQARRRPRPRINLIRQNRESGEFEDYYGSRLDTAEVCCGVCNNGWMSQLDNAASRALKPLVRGRRPVLLGPDEQTEVSAWCVKTVTVNDLPLTGGRSVLRAYAPGLRREKRAPDFLEVWHGPPSMVLSDSFRSIGVLPHDGTMLLGRPPDTQTVPLHAWSLMLGYADLLVRPVFRWIPLDPPLGYQRLWPVEQSTVEIAPRSAPTSTAQPRDLFSCPWITAT